MTKRSILALHHQSLTAPEPRAPLLATTALVPCASGCTPVTWEQQLREEYLAKYGSPTLHLPETLENSRQVMALRLSTRFMGDGFRNAAHELFNDPLFVSGVVLSRWWRAMEWAKRYRASHPAACEADKGLRPVRLPWMSCC